MRGVRLTIISIPVCFLYDGTTIVVPIGYLLLTGFFIRLPFGKNKIINVGQQEVYQ